MERENKYMKDQGMLTRKNRSEDEVREMLDWFYSEEGSEELELFYKKKWEEARYSTLPSAQQHQMYLHLKEEIKKLPVHKKRKSAVALSWWKYAAIILVCIGLNAGYNILTGNEPANVTPEREFILSAGKGEKASVNLPDGTIVHLNSCSQLTYTGNYGESHRHVSLTGEAYFDIAKNESLPFILKAGDMEIEALGTSFNVKAYREDNTIMTTLFSGKLRVADQNEEVILFPRQYACLHKDTRTISMGLMNDVSSANSWINNEVMVSSAPLDEIIKMMNRMYKTPVRLQSDDLRKYHFSGTIKDGDLYNVLDIISITAPVKYETINDTIVIKRK